MTIYPEIENWDDYRIKNREYSQCKLFNEFFNLNCDKSIANLDDYLYTHLGLSTKKTDIKSLINTFRNIGLIVVINSSVQPTDKLPKYLQSLQKSIKQFDKKHRVAFDEYDTPADKRAEGKTAT